MYGKRTYTVEEAKLALERYCSYQERSHKEVEEKLCKMNMITEARQLIIQHLLQENYLNESRFAQSFARGKFRLKKWGRKRIVRELKQRDISDYNIKVALKEIPDTDYLDTFDQLAEKKWQELSRETNLPKRKKKLITYLEYRGWEANLIWDKLRELSP